jgi:hypothetical protein
MPATRVRGRDGEVDIRLGVGRVAGRDLDAAVHQPFADGQPDPADPAGDERDLPVHVSHLFTSMSLDG